MTREPGAQLGPYEIVDLRGKGGMGEVYRARDTRLDRDVAIKVLPAELSADPEFKRRFEREAKTISQLQHENVCRLYDIGSQGGTDYLVMEYLEGETGTWLCSTPGSQIPTRLCAGSPRPFSRRVASW